MNPRHTTRPICPHCGSIAPYGDPRFPWMSWHLDSHIHRNWWRLRRLIRWLKFL